MFEFLNRLNGGELIGLTAVIMGPMIAIVAVIATQWGRVRVAEMEGCLKQQMLEKGMSPAEIEQVLKASKVGGATGNAALDKAALVQMMVEHGYEGEDIERVV